MGYFPHKCSIRAVTYTTADNGGKIRDVSDIPGLSDLSCLIYSVNLSIPGGKSDVGRIERRVMIPSSSSEIRPGGVISFDGVDHLIGDTIPSTRGLFTVVVIKSWQE